MSKFNAATAVEALEYDFSAYSGGEGVIPEPSTAQVDEFFKTLKDLYSHINPDSDDKEAIEALKAMGEDEANRIGDRLKDSLAALCSNSPSREDLDRLPFRVFSAFSGWLAGSLRPEAKTSGTKP